MIYCFEGLRCPCRGIVDNVVLVSQAPAGVAATDNRARGEQLGAACGSEGDGKIHGERCILGKSIVSALNIPLLCLQLLKCALRDLLQDKEVQKNLLQVHLNGSSRIEHPSSYSESCCLSGCISCLQDCCRPMTASHWRKSRASCSWRTLSETKYLWVRKVSRRCNKIDKSEPGFSFQGSFAENLAFLLEALKKGENEVWIQRWSEWSTLEGLEEN